MKIALIGYGKMGHMIESVALERGHQIVGVIDPTIDVQRDDVQCTKDGDKVQCTKAPSAISFDSEEFRSADVAIEFTTPATAKDNILRAWAQGVPVVCGTTGWDAESLSPTLPHREGDKSRIVLKNEHGKTMLVWSSNFSVGVNIFFNLNRYLAEEIQNAKLKIQNDAGGYTPSIKEIHHIHKLDKPSGTAKTLAEQIQNAKCKIKNYEVPIESVREGEVPGTHTVTWDSEEDTIVITHIAKGRRGFALGAVLAAEEVVSGNTSVIPAEAE